MSQNQSDQLCHSCQADWGVGEWSADCCECDGGALERDCTFCKGRCGGKSQRAINDSHNFARAQWMGSCLLSPSEQGKIRKRLLKDYEQEQGVRRFDHSSIMEKFESGDPGKIVKAVMTILVFVGLSWAIHSDDFRQFFSGRADNVAREEIAPLIDADAVARIRVNLAKKVYEETKGKNKELKPKPYSETDTIIQFSTDSSDSMTIILESMFK